MHCPNCLTADSKVIETRILQSGLAVRRRRKCESCDKRFTTYENINIQLPVVAKADGRREHFNREKIMKGLRNACQKRPISQDQLDDIIDKMIKKLTELNLNEVPSETMGNFVMEALYQLDPVAYVRFASFYWNFSDVDSFVSTLQKKVRIQKSHLKNHHYSKGGIHSGRLQ
jgi:transcriptional repressor NrdR